MGQCHHRRRGRTGDVYLLLQKLILKRDKKKQNRLLLWTDFARSEGRVLFGDEEETLHSKKMVADKLLGRRR